MRHVLIIEDQCATAKALAEMAIHAGASSVAIAADEAMAIAAARDHAPRIILSDVDLGPGGRGPNAVAAIQAEIGPVPAIFITGNPGEAAALARATAILAKPVTANRVQSVVADVMATCPDPRRPTAITAAHSESSSSADCSNAMMPGTRLLTGDDGRPGSVRDPRYRSTSMVGRPAIGPAKTAHHQLRGSQRFPTSLPAVLVIGQHRHEVTIADVSATGARVRCAGDIPPHGAVILEAGPERISGRLVWRTDRSAGLQFSRPVAPLEIVRQNDPALRSIFRRLSASGD